MNEQQALAAESQIFNDLSDDEFLKLMVDSGATLTYGEDEEESE